MIKSKKRRLKEKGITLIALVVTIIILLILVGVAITSVTGDNGLFRKAREATNTYKDAERDEQETLEQGENELSKVLNPAGNGESSGGNVPTGYVEGNTKVTISDGSYYIPDGFKLAEDSGKKINEGIVVEDKNENQWVWIPCYVEGGVGADVAGAVKYDRYAFTRDDWPYRQSKVTKENGSPDLDSDGSQKIVNENTKDAIYFHEAINSTDEASISHFGGFYIGRYEAGDGTITNTDTPRLRNEYDDVNNRVTLKKGQAPYNWVPKAQSITLSNGMATANNYDTTKMYTKLCSSYAWDTALKFIGGDYATNSTQGNYNSTAFSYTDVTGVIQPKNIGSSVLTPTGQSTAVKNIYDMGGNVGEFVSEEICMAYTTYVYRGGSFGDDGSDWPASLRTSYGGHATNSVGFRPALFLNNTV